jgi:phosphoribosylanthranilate isomerase
MTKVKICGIRFFDDGFDAIEAGADYLGFNFYPKSLRYVEPEVCKRIIGLLKAQFPEVKYVGVFVNSETDYIKDVMRFCSLDLIQLHGDETPAVLAQLGFSAYKAFRGNPEYLDDYLRATAPAFLLDAYSKNAFGGTGQQSDWSAAAKLASQHDFFLAGGLTPENVSDAILQVHPWGVDTASGIESVPGVKDAKKMKAFVSAVRLADQSGISAINLARKLERL